MDAKWDTDFRWERRGWVLIRCCQSRYSNTLGMYHYILSKQVSAAVVMVCRRPSCKPGYREDPYSRLSLLGCPALTNPQILSSPRFNLSKTSTMIIEVTFPMRTATLCPLHLVLPVRPECQQRLDLAYTDSQTVCHSVVSINCFTAGSAAALSSPASDPSTLRPAKVLARERATYA